MKSILLDLPLPIMTPRLILKSPQPGQGMILNEAILESFDTLNLFMAWAKEKPTIDESEEFVRLAAANWILKKNDEPYLPFFIFDKENQHFIGSIGYHHFDWAVPCIEIGYWIRNSFAKRGFMTEALNALTQYAFKQLKVKRIALTCDTDNIRSQNLPKKLGYELESVIKSNRVKVTGEISDTKVFVRHNLAGCPDLKVTWK